MEPRDLDRDPHRAGTVEFGGDISAGLVENRLDLLVTVAKRVAPPDDIRDRIIEIGLRDLEGARRQHVEARHTVVPGFFAGHARGKLAERLVRCSAGAKHRHAKGSESPFQQSPTHPARPYRSPS